MGEKLLALDPKRRRFVEEFCIDWNATQAAARAGYSRKTAMQQGSRLLSFVEVQEAVAEVMQAATERCQIAGDQILGETAKLAFLNMMDYIRIGSDGEPFVDLSSTTRAHGAGLLSFKHKEYKDGRGEDARDIVEIEIRLNPAKFNALVKLGERLGLWKPEGGPDASGVDVAQLVADEKLRVERMEEIAARYLPKPKQIEKAKGEKAKVA